MAVVKSEKGSKRSSSKRPATTNQTIKSGRVKILRSAKDGSLIAAKSGHKKSIAASVLSAKSDPSQSTEILDRIKTWAGGETEALVWFRSFPIPAFGDRTAESLVKTGKAEDVRDYLDAVAVGAFQ